MHELPRLTQEQHENGISFFVEKFSSQNKEIVTSFIKEEGTPAAHKRTKV